MTFKQFTENKKLCVFHYLCIYVQRTALLRKTTTQLLITTTKLHKAASNNSISRWLKTILTLAGIDTTHFSAGSSRSATTSKAK